MSALPIRLQRDIRAFFGSYTNGCRRADDLLFREGKSGKIAGKIGVRSSGKIGVTGKIGVRGKSVSGENRCQIIFSGENRCQGKIEGKIGVRSSLRAKSVSDHLYGENRCQGKIGVRSSLTRGKSVSDHL
jgi:hypothetical protein